MKTSELHDRLGCSNNTLHRLTERGILQPTRIEAGTGTGRWGYAFDWNHDEQRAAAAVVRFLGSHLLEPGKSPTGQEARDDALRAIAAAARVPLPDQLAPRWLILLADGTCTRGSDVLAAAVVSHRTLIELQEIGERV